MARGSLLYSTVFIVIYTLISPGISACFSFGAVAADPSYCEMAGGKECRHRRVAGHDHGGSAGKGHCEIRKKCHEDGRTASYQTDLDPAPLSPPLLLSMPSAPAYTVCLETPAYDNNALTPPERPPSEAV